MKSHPERARRIVVLLGAAIALAAPLRAQQPAGARQGAGRAGLEQQLARRIAAVVQRRLGLNDDQLRQLIATNRRYEAQRRQLVQQERADRMDIRAEVLRGDSADQGRVSYALDGLLAIERRRLDLVAEEQRDLARFLTPVQRAEYLAVQEQIRQRIAKLRRQQLRRGAAAGARPRAGRFRGRGSAPLPAADST